ncbi:MAG TPA: PfkB family carbohydrate kinase [Candidatus Acidoferrales bacterium]|nr:PfkB family carbohydrate kinase [Candidatus Acidoferrales bacterium]
MKHASASPAVDVVGVGINATDTIIRLPSFPTPDSKTEVLSAEVSAGGQVASAMIACRRWGVAVRYVGKIGDDLAGRLQQSEMEREGVEAHWLIARGSHSQSAFILVDQASGERTILWKRDPNIALHPEDLERQWISGARVLLVDGHDTEAAAQAADWARQESIPVVGDFDNLYSHVEVLLHRVDFPVTSKAFPEKLTGETNLLKSLPRIACEFKCRVIATTLGRLGVLAWNGREFLLSPGFRVDAVDTTGAGDIFHAGFVYGLIGGWPLQEILEFSNAAAALNCTGPGARGHIASLGEIERTRSTGERSELAYTEEVLRDLARAARRAGAGP